ncbi:MAG TPA: nuclear transport factor 2 family protein [Edaphocola sp.]|nr:nuclear transport factor 2 family protein [Edaphocola sp.]
MNKFVYIIMIAFLVNACNTKSNDMTHKKLNDFSVNNEIKTGNNMNIHHYTDAVDQYMRSLNESDLEGILSLYADDATVEDPVGSEIVSGIDSLRKFYTGAVNIELNVERTGAVRIAGMEAAFPFELEMNINGVHTLTEVIDVFRFNEEGKIISMRAFHGPSNRRLIDSAPLSSD